MASKTHDYTGQYRKADLPRDVAAVEVDDPYADVTMDVKAQVERGAWRPPERPAVRVLRALRTDPLGRMHVRGQINDYQLEAGRAYQTYYVAAQGTRSSASDPMRNRGGASHGEPLSDRRLRAIKKLRELDDIIASRHGAEGLQITREVLGECVPLEQAARALGAGDGALRSYGWLFRRCLAVIAVRLGYATSARSKP